MKFNFVKRVLPAPISILLALISAFALVLAFPHFEFWWLAWFAPAFLLFAVEREKESLPKSFIIGWIFGILFFFGSCWWLTYAPINYAAFPPWLAYFLLFGVTVAAGLFPALFALIFALLLRRFGSYALWSAPFVWTMTEFLRFWLTGNNWNAVGYSQAFKLSVAQFASVGGVYFVGFIVMIESAAILFWLSNVNRRYPLYVAAMLFVLLGDVLHLQSFDGSRSVQSSAAANIIAVQPNVPMSGLTLNRVSDLRRRHLELAEDALSKSRQQITAGQSGEQLPTTVIFPESPMNFMYSDDPDFQKFVREFAAKNNVSVLFNSAEPEKGGTQYYNSAVLVNAAGRKIGEYDKIYLVPFGESVPSPLQGLMPALVGSFAYGKNYDLLPFGDAKAGVLICFESHFGSLSREFAREGADFLVEITNDGYLGPTPILRQHLANAVFRAVETNRPVVRVTNVGISAYINERGEILEPTASYTDDTRFWTVSKSDGGQTFYVKFGDWFAWLCSLVTLTLLILSFRKKGLAANDIN